MGNLERCPGRPHAGFERATRHSQFATINEHVVVDRDVAVAVQPAAAGADEHLLEFMLIDLLKKQIGFGDQPGDRSRRSVADCQAVERMIGVAIKRFVVDERAVFLAHDRHRIERRRNVAAGPIGAHSPCVPTPRSVGGPFPGDGIRGRRAVELANHAGWVEAFQGEAVAIKLGVAGGTGAVAGVEGELFLE